LKRPFNRRSGGRALASPGARIWLAVKTEIVIRIVLMSISPAISRREA
jgi:hypothetical protein